LRNEGLHVLVQCLLFVDDGSHLKIIHFSFQANVSLVLGLPNIQNDLQIILEEELTTFNDLRLIEVGKILEKL